MIITLTLKDFKNLKPEFIDILFLTKLLKDNYYMLENNPDLWGSFLYAKRIFDFNISKENKSLSVYSVRDDLIQTENYITYNYKINLDKNRKYKNRNNSEYLDLKK